MHIGKTCPNWRSIFPLRISSALYKKSQEENDAELKAVLAEKPLSVEMVDGHRIERYSKGLVNIVGGEGGGVIDLRKAVNRNPETDT
jgi:hypothetical protein